MQSGNEEILVSQIYPNPGKGIEEKMISVYPNPASDRITVKTWDENSPTTLKIYDNMSQLIRTIIFSNGSEHVVDTHDLRTGIYFIEASTGSGLYITKLVINR